MPTVWPDHLQAFLGRIVRNISISRLRNLRAQKRGSGLEILLDELDECTPMVNAPQEELEAQELGMLLTQWLNALPPLQRHIFVRRYWHGVSVQTLAQERGCRPNAMTQQLSTLRKKLQKHLEGEGIAL